jgi:hypothetical protein
MLRISEILIELVAEALRWLRLAFRSSQSIRAENLSLRRQLALYIERGVKLRRIDPATRIALTLPSRLFDWRDALAVVRPVTLIRWHRAGWKLFWRLKSRPGRPPIPVDLQALIRRIANENPSWGEERRVRTSSTAHFEIVDSSLQGGKATYVVRPRHSRFASNHGSPGAVFATSSRRNGMPFKPHQSWMDCITNIR